MALPSPPHQRLVNEAIRLATEEILEQMPVAYSQVPVAYSQALERLIRRALRHGIEHYAEGLDTLERPLRPLAHGRVRG